MYKFCSSCILTGLLTSTNDKHCTVHGEYLSIDTYDVTNTHFFMYANEKEYILNIIFASN